LTALLAVLIAAGTAAVIAFPLFRPGPQPTPDPVGPEAIRAALRERKLQVYAAIRELGFDYNTDKLEKDDYEHEVERLKAEAVDIVRQMDDLESEASRGSASLEAEIEAARKRLEGEASPAATAATPAPGAATFCTQCGTQAGADDRFCASCGTQLRGSSG
jgi:hypothetical protein